MKSDQKNILQVVPAMQEGGVERGTLEMAHYIKSQNWGSFVASHGGRWVEDLEKFGVKHVKLPLHKRNPLTIILNGFRLARLVRAYEIDLLHTRSRAPAWSCLIASKLTKTTLLTSFHGTHKIQNKAKWLYNSVMTKGVYTIANSEFIRNHLKENYFLSDEKIITVARGFDTTLFNPDLYSDKDRCQFFKEHHLDLDTPVILMPGRLTRWKGQQFLLDTLAQMKDEKWQLLIVGGASKKKAYLAELEAQVKTLGLEDRCQFLGSRNDMPLLYYICDIMVSCSLIPEAFGRTAIEASAMKKPVVATNHGGYLETIKDTETGFLVTPYDTESMAKKLRTLLQQRDLRQQMGDKGHAWVHNTFTTEKMCAGEFAVYKKIFSSKINDK